MRTGERKFLGYWSLNILMVGFLENSGKIAMSLDSLIWIVVGRVGLAFIFKFYHLVAPA